VKVTRIKVKTIWIKKQMVNMNLDLEENWDAKHKLYETSNMGMVLEPKSLRIEK
jgi:hypothetical protein